MRAVGVGEADRNRVLLFGLKAPEAKLLRNIKMHAKLGVRHAEKHLRMRDTLQAGRARLFSQLELKSQNVARVSLENGPLGFRAAANIFLRPRCFFHGMFNPSTHKLCLSDGVAGLSAP
jgi:hypothetical protein